MTVRFNHTIVHAHDKTTSAAWLCELLGLPPPLHLGPFAVVQAGEASLDFLTAEGEISPRHFAFLVSEAEFDAILARLEARRIRYWADPFHRQPQQINCWDDGRGLYFDDPDGHSMEILTRPYGSGGSQAEHPHPLLDDTDQV